MTLKIDNLGRIVVPKPLRQKLGIEPGAELEINESGGSLVLTPVQEEAAMVKVNGFWVHQGKAPANFDLLKQIEDSREARHREVLGL
jgi:AbrB family looped-hinge helix DNA binding protein